MAQSLPTSPGMRMAPLARPGLFTRPPSLTNPQFLDKLAKHFSTSLHFPILLRRYVCVCDRHANQVLLIAKAYLAGCTHGLLPRLTYRKYDRQFVSAGHDLENCHHGLATKYG
jgi:hypothetical protein